MDCITIFSGGWMLSSDSSFVNGKENCTSLGAKTYKRGKMSKIIKIRGKKLISCYKLLAAFLLIIHILKYNNWLSTYVQCPSFCPQKCVSVHLDNSFVHMSVLCILVHNYRCLSILILSISVCRFSPQNLDVCSFYYIY